MLAVAASALSTPTSPTRANASARIAATAASGRLAPDVALTVDILYLPRQERALLRDPSAHRRLQRNQTLGERDSNVRTCSTQVEQEGTTESWRDVTHRCQAPIWWESGA